MVAKTVSLIGLLLLSGCSTISQQEIFDQVKHSSSSHGAKELQWIKSPEDASKVEESVWRLLEKPLQMDDAVRIALINNRALQQSYAQIGISQSDLVQAGLVNNPLLGYSVGRSNGVTKSTISLDIAFLDMLWIPLRRELGKIALEEIQASIGNEVLEVVRDTKKAYIELVAIEKKMLYYKDILVSHEASLQLVTRQYTAGNITKRNLLKIQNSYQHARVESIEIAKKYAMARESLNRICGLYGGQTNYTLDSSLKPIESPPNLSKGLEKIAIASRLDMRAAIAAVDYAAKEAGYTKNTRLLSELELSIESEKNSNEDRLNSFGIKIPIPIFDFGQARVSKAEALYNQNVHHLYEKAVVIRSEVREKYALLLHAHTIVHEYDDVIVKINQQILEETQLYYNGMLDGIYELLEDKRHLVDAKIEAVEAYSEFWKAQADLEYAVGGNYNEAR
ncbi:TolC family protein [Sulfurimonas sp.]|uniref:TolC family protein n=1 Tax=Sulfurimonas sp. TaxID=2022749 RepID=UPI0025DA9C3F|nr:TolC family protein [Sulfurimonas sp.]MDD5158272.1 TolC family protein [Sulfurimonas sp.]